MKKIARLLLLLVITTIITSSRAAYAVKVEEMMNNFEGAKQKYSTMLSPVYLKENTVEENISTQNGELSLAQTDYCLPGRNGLDLEIKRLYKNGASNVQEANVKYVDGALVDYTYSDENTSSFYEDRYNLGIGMRFSFPSMEIKSNSDGSSFKFLHTETGDVYEIQGPYVENNVTTYKIANQTVKDFIIKEDTSYSNGQSDGISKYLMVGKTGKKTYFSDDGRVLAIIDRYGNTIKFEYTQFTNNIKNTVRTKKLITKITDSVGRVVTIDYKDNYAYTVKPQAGQDNSDNQNPDTVYSGDLSGNFQVVVNLPNGKKIIYDKSAALVTNDTKQVIRTRLQKVYDVDGKLKYQYWYDQPSLGFTYENGTNYTAFNRYENLCQIDYCKTNRLTRYSYDTFTKRLNNELGSMQYRKVCGKEELIKKGYDSTKANYMNRFICDVKNKVVYKYTNEPDGFGYQGYSAIPKNELKDKYKYYCEVTDSRGENTKYTYDGEQELENTEEYGNDHREITKTEFDIKKFPKKTEKLIYNVVNGQSIGEPSKKIENFRYDECGNLTDYTGPIANRDDSGYPKDTEHTVTYSYDANKYNVLVLKTWNKDANTKCQISYDADSLGNIISEKKMHFDNGDKPVITDYEYDSYGNMTKKTVHSSDKTYTTNYEYGIDADGNDQKGAYLTKEYQIIGGRELSKKYSYDFNSGNKTCDVDENSNRILYDYDNLERVKKITYADGTTKQYEYIDSPNADSEVKYTNQKGTLFSYKYDILGNMVSYSVNQSGSNKAISQVEYDSNGNKIEETDSNGNVTKYEYDSQDRIIKKSYCENGNVKDCVTLSYSRVNDGDAVLLLTITDESGYVTKNYFDAEDRLIKVSSTPDKVNYYNKTYRYDYDGNVTAETDGRNNTTYYIYDDLGRVVKQKDAAGNETFMTYNSLDKVLSKEEAGGKITAYTYDEKGRATSEKVYKKGSNDYTYKNYIYDNADNVTTITSGSFKDGKDIVSSYVSYKYDNMNRLTDEYDKIDDSRQSHTSYKYDANGNKTDTIAYANAGGSKYKLIRFAYDIIDKPILEEGYVLDGSVKRGYYKKECTNDLEGNVLEEREYLGEQNGTTEYTKANYTYDYRDRVTTKTEDFGASSRKETTYSYDKKGNPVTETLIKNGEPCTTTREYDGMGNVIRVTDPMGNTSRYVYDANGNKVKEIDARYYSKAAETNNPDMLNTVPCIEYEYDPMNRLVKTTSDIQGDRRVIAYTEYDGRGNVIKKCEGEEYNASNPSNSLGDIYEYDENNKPIKFTSSAVEKYNRDNGDNKVSKKCSYDGSGNVITEEDAYGRKTFYTYFLNGKLKEKTYPDGKKETYDYDLTGELEITAKDRAENVTRTYNTVFDKPYRIEYPDGTNERYEYTSTGQVKVKYDKNGTKQEFEYDKDDNVIASKEYIDTKDGVTSYRLTKYSYDEAKNPISKETFLCKTSKDGGDDIITSAGDRITYTYDKAGKLIKQSGPNGREVINEYDKNGNVATTKTKVSDGSYYVKRYAYDLLSRVVEDTTLVDINGLDQSKLQGAVFDKEYPTMVKSSITYTYYDNGQVKTKTDANKHAISYEYDGDNHVTKVTDPKNNSNTFTYDLNGNMVAKRNARNVVTSYEYDDLGRLIREKQPTSDGSLGVTRYIYDANGNKIKEIKPNNYVSDKDTPELAESMKGMSYTYDSMNRLVSAYSPEGKLLQTVKYDNNGNIQKVVDGLRFNGNIDTSKGQINKYDGLNRLISITDAAGGIISYEYDVLDNKVKETDQRGNTTEYAYNPDNTLAKVIYPDGGIAEYTYDLLGQKLTFKDQRGNITTYAYNSFGKERVVKTADNAVTESRYDLCGNLTLYKDQMGNSSYYGYDENNKLVLKKLPLEKDSGGGIVYSIETASYDEEGNILSKTLSGTKDTSSKREARYTYYDNNLVNTVTDPSGAVTKSYYDKDGNCIKVTKERESESILDVNKYKYDSQDRVIADIKLVGEKYIDTSAATEKYKKLEDAEYPDKIQLITAFEYDVLGNKIKVIEPLASLYDENDKEDMAKYTTTYDYDILNRLQRVTRKYKDTQAGEADKLSDVYTEYTYDECGNKIKERNERGFETKYTYDKVNRIKTVTDPNNNTTAYEYDKAGNNVSKTDARGNTVSFTYDNMNRLKTTINADKVVTDYKIYDAKGNVIKEADAKGYKAGADDESRYYTYYSYDLANRLVKITDSETDKYNKANGKDNLTGKFTKKYDYDQYGEKIGETDAYGNSTAFVYDADGRLVKVTDPESTSTTYVYDKAGNRTAMTDGRGKLTAYSYGDFGLVSAKVNAEGNTASYKYDLELNNSNKVDENGNALTFAYDNQNRLISRSVKGTSADGRDISETISYGYDEAGNRKWMKDKSGTSTYSYDNNNRLTAVNKDGANEISYTFDVVGNISTVTDKTGFTTAYNYDNNNRMISVTFAASGADKTTKYSYDLNGNRESITYDGGVKEEYTYDRNNHPLTVINKNPYGAEISKYTYTYDLNGLQTSKQDSNGTTKYTYDTLGRIRKVEAPDKLVYYGYDKAGNRVSQEESSSAKQKSDYVDSKTNSPVEYTKKISEYMYSSSNMLISLTEKMFDEKDTQVLTKTTRYIYDKNGNQIREAAEYTALHDAGKREADKTAVYGEGVQPKSDEAKLNNVVSLVKNSFDGFNRLTQAEEIKAGVRTIDQYAYNGDDLRVQKISKASDKGYKAETTNYIYDRTNVVLETDGEGKLKVRYVRGINYIGRIDDTGRLSYILYNGHGDVVQTVASDGTVENKYDYDIFGNPTLEQEQYSMDIRYAGYMYDGDTGNYYLQSRYYDSYTGRFISEDTYTGIQDDPLSLNLYTYCQNDPVDGYDPDGHRMMTAGESTYTSKTKNTKDTGKYTDNKGKVHVIAVSGDNSSSKVVETIYNNKTDAKKNKAAEIDTFQNTVTQNKVQISETRTVNTYIPSCGIKSVTDVVSTTVEGKKTTILTEQSIKSIAYGGPKDTQVYDTKHILVTTPTTTTMTDITSLNKYVTKTGAKKFSLTNTVSVTTDKKNITVSGTTVKNGKVIDSGSGKMSKDKFEDLPSSMQKTFIEMHTTNQKIYKAAYTAKFIGQAIPYVLETRIKNFTNDKIADLRAQGFSKSDAEFWGNVTSGMMLGELGGAAFSEFIKAGESADVVVGTGLGKLGSKLSSSENIGKVVEETEEEAKALAQGGSKPNFGLKNMPKSPKELLENGWKDVTPEGMAKNTSSREYLDPKTGTKVRFDSGTEGANGFEGKDHYHVYNPNSTGKGDYYLDVNGNPIRKGSKGSHIVP